MTISAFTWKRHTFKFRAPHALCPTEWEIKGKLCIADKRVQELLTVSYGNERPDQGHTRDVSLLIGNQAVILDPLNQNTLVKLLLEANAT